MRVTATLKGTVPSATLTFQISDSPSAEKSSAATSQHVSVTKAGTYPMPVPFKPTKAGSWAVTVTYSPKPAKDSRLSVSGLPPISGAPAPFPQLVTAVTG